MPRLYGVAPDRREQRRDANAVLAFALKNSFHLSQMVQVMSCDHTRDMGHTLIAPLLMYAVVVPQGLRDSFQQIQIALPQDAVLLQ